MDAIDHWQHEHTFGQDALRAGEGRTLIVIALTAVMMVVEIAAGLAFGSMALLADGLHMGSHATALSIAAVAYIYARRNAGNRKWSFGTGKVNALGGFTGALLLAGFALAMAWESIDRLFHPVAIVFNEAIIVAVLGLLVNGASVAILGVHDHGHDQAHGQGHGHGHGDHNLRAAYLHVLADAVTSLLAIFALLAGKLFGLAWMDPVMGILGSVLVARWSWGLLRDTSGVLLDREAPAEIRRAVRTALEGEGDDRIADLHVWSIGPGIFAAVISVITHDERSPDHYKRLIPDELGIVHPTIEIHRCRG